jgi:hypothetical protein
MVDRMCPIISDPDGNERSNLEQTISNGAFFLGDGSKNLFFGKCESATGSYHAKFIRIRELDWY